MCEDTKHISATEMLMIAATVKNWGESWVHAKVLIFCDNNAIVRVIDSGRATDGFMMKCIRGLCYITSNSVWSESCNCLMFRIYAARPAVEVVSEPRCPARVQKADGAHEYEKEADLRSPFPVFTPVVKGITWSLFEAWAYRCIPVLCLISNWPSN